MGSGSLDVDYDDATGRITQINSLRVNLPDQVLTINGSNLGVGTSIVTITQGNNNPGANDDIFLQSGAAASSAADSNDATGQGAGVFENDGAPAAVHPDFATFTDVVDDCTGDMTICGLLGILSLDGVRYRILGTVSGLGGDAFELTAQSGNNSIYKVEFSTAAVPVPAAVWLFGSALGLLGWMRRRAA